MFQSTIAKEAFAEGVGLHTGVSGHVRLLPAPADTGIVFRRTDLDNFPIEAQGHNVARVSYATSLMKQGVLAFHDGTSSRGDLFLRYRQHLHRHRFDRDSHFGWLGRAVYANAGASPAFANSAASAAI